MSKCPPRQHKLGSKHKLSLIHFPSHSPGSISSISIDGRRPSWKCVCNSSSSRGANHSTAIDHLGRWHMFSLCTLSFSLAFPSLSDDLFPVNCFCCLSFFIIIAYPFPPLKKYLQHISGTSLDRYCTATVRSPLVPAGVTSVQSHTWVANYCCLTKRYTHNKGQSTGTTKAPEEHRGNMLALLIKLPFYLSSMKSLLLAGESWMLTNATSFWTHSLSPSGITHRGGHFLAGSSPSSFQFHWHCLCLSLSFSLSDHMDTQTHVFALDDRLQNVVFYPSLSLSLKSADRTLLLFFIISAAMMTMTAVFCTISLSASLILKLLN